MVNRKKVVYFLISIILIVFILSELFLSGLAADYLKKVFLSKADSIDSIKIELSSFPALKMLSGSIDQVEMEAEGLLVNNLYVNKMKLSYQDIKLKRNGFTGVNTLLEAIITEESLSNFIRTEYSDLKGFQLKIRPEKIILEGHIEFLNMLFNLQLSGNLVLNDKKDIYFVPVHFQIENLNIPVDVLKTYIEGFDFSFNIKELGIPLDISSVNINHEYIVISGGKKIE